MSPWLLVKVLRGHEKRVCLFLTEIGYEAFCPFYGARRYTTRGRVMEIERPLFPLYVFCRFTPKARGRIVEVPGVVGFAGSKKSDRIADDKEIEAIRQLALLGAFRYSPRKFSPGEQVLIDAGPLAGLSGVTLRPAESENRVVISVTLLQRSIAVEVDSAWVHALVK